MIRRRSWKLGQSTAEYAVVIALVLGAVVAMQTYLRRTLQARVADGSDQIPLFPAGARKQFEPNYLTSDSNTTTNLTSNIKVTGSSGNISTVTGNVVSKTSRNGGQTELGI